MGQLAVGILICLSFSLVALGFSSKVIAVLATAFRRQRSTG